MNRYRNGLRFALIVLLLLPVSCTSPSQSPEEAAVEEEPFGVLPSGEQVTAYTLRNDNGMEVRALNYGGIILSIRVPDAEGVFEDVTLGYDSLDTYLEESPYFGALIGRYGNRIANGQFTLNGTTYTLAKNNGPNHLHGGLKGFDKVIWNTEPFEDERGVGLVFTRTSPDGEEGYPGNLDVKVTYTLTDDNELIFDYEATTDKPTPVNLTQHTYFNLAGDDHPDILGHVLTLNADAFLPVDTTLIPTGEFRPVDGTPFDFRTPTPIGTRIDADDEQIRAGGGYDHCWVLNASGGDSLTLAARLYSPESGRVMEVFTTEPGIQFYSGNFLGSTPTGRGGVNYGHRAGLALETQHFPNSPNEPNFPSTILEPGDTYRTRTVYKFSVQRNE